MSGRLQALVRPVLIVLLAFYLSGGAHGQEQNQPAAAKSQEQEPPASPQTEQKPAPAASPQQGTLVVPSTHENAKGEPAEASAESTQGGRMYTIRQGDTLWDISHAFLKDPFLWPFIWKANPSITDPDLIYPGNRLLIPSMAPVERAMQTPAQRSAEPSGETGPVLFGKRAPREETAPAEADKPASRLILPEEKPSPLIDKYSMLNAGFISQDESDDLIVGSKEGKTLLGYDDIVYVTIRSKANAAPGDKFLIYQPLDRVKHPATGEVFGRLIKVLGILELTAKGADETFSARITLSFDSASNGSMLTPYQEPTLIYPKAGQAKTGDISGYILEVTDTRTINGQIDIVYLDKGSADGVEGGDRFAVYARTDESSYPRASIGEIQVFLVKEHTSTAVVRKSNDTLAKGDRIEYRK